MLKGLNKNGNRLLTGVLITIGRLRVSLPIQDLSIKQIVLVSRTAPSAEEIQD